jgi:hypothetical protein
MASRCARSSADVTLQIATIDETENTARCRCHPKRNRQILPDDREWLAHFDALSRERANLDIHADLHDLRNSVGDQH